MMFALGVIVGVLLSIVCLLAMVVSRRKILHAVDIITAATAKRPATIINMSNPFKEL